MSLTTTLKPSGDLDASDVEDLRTLKRAVYPPDEGSEWEGASREWAGPQWGVFVREDSGRLVSYTGVVRTNGTADGRPVTIGGLGGIATHPAHRGRGYAAIGMARGLDHLTAAATEFALLVCRDELVAYYEKLGWVEFAGDLLVTQFGEPEIFTFNRVMVGDLVGKAPRAGTLDLGGPPW